MSFFDNISSHHSCYDGFFYSAAVYWIYLVSCIAYDKKIIKNHIFHKSADRYST